MSETVSVVIPASRPEALARCLASIARSRGPAPLEALVVLNGAGEACERAARSVSPAPAGLRLLRGGGLSPGAARNRAAARASGDVLCFLDDDVAVAPAYFETLAAKLAAYPEAAALGGPNLTPPGAGLFERCVGHVLASAFGAGPTSARCRGLDADAWTGDRSLILCNLCVRREALETEGLAFDEALRRNEENLLLARLAARGRRALHAPALWVHHERRSSLAAFARQCFLSGEGRARMTAREPRSLEPAYLAPLAPAAALLALPAAPGAAGAALGAYAAAAAAAALVETRRSGEPPGAFARLWLLFAAAHLSYAAGLLAGAAMELPQARRYVMKRGLGKQRLFTKPHSFLPQAR